MSCTEHPVGRAPDAGRTTVEDMRVDHGRVHVPVAQQFLDGLDIVAVREQVGREGVPQGVPAGPLGDAGPPDRLLDGPLEN